MRKSKSFVSAIVGVTLALGSPAAANPAWSGDARSAEQLRELDIMLMVTSLRCRRSSNDFTADYDDFAHNHRQTMNAAAGQLRDTYASGRSRRAQNRTIDTLSTTMANRYGLGHPWLDCAELRSVVRTLADERDVGVLVTAAEELLADRPRQGVGQLSLYQAD